MLNRSHPHETEVKFRLADRAGFEERLRSLGASPSAPEFETNELLDDRRGSVKARGQALRLREVNGRGLLTLKGKKSIKRGVKTRLELETEVELPRRLLRIFEELEFAVRFRYEKRRTTWRFARADRPVVVVDETPIGLFAEIEGEEGAIRLLASELAIDEHSFLSESYVSLYRLARQADTTLPPDMVFR